MSRIGLEDRDKIGIIGANGSGKTTFLRVIAGTETPDTGKVTRIAGQNARLFVAESAD